ncbi:hypothetical protein Tco_0085112 [Tanacetum coccineum]
MAGPVEGGGPEGADDREETPPPLTKEQIEGHVSALKSLIKSHNQKNKGDPIRLDFEMVDTEVQGHNVVKGKEVTDEDLRKPFKKARRTPFTRRILEFAGPEYKMPNNIKLYDAFKERWTVETGFIMGVPEVMKISSFMDSVKSPELAKRFSDKVPTTVNEMMERDTRPFRSTRPVESRRDEYKNSYRGRYAYRTIREREDRAPYLPPPRGENNRRAAPVLTLNSLTKRPKEILATETQLRLPAPRPMINPLRSGNTDRYYDYHQEKGHYANDCIQLRKQLEIALEAGKLNHLMKDVRQRRRGSHGRDDPLPAKIINVISVNFVKDKKRKFREATESWMNILISFLAISSEEIFEEPLIVKAGVEGYLVRRIYVDEGSSVEVMFEHCFENFSPKIKAMLRETHTDLVGFVGEVSKQLGKIKLEVCFGNGGLCRKTSMKFIMVRAPSPYNVILGRPGLKTLRVIPSTIHSMMKFPTPKGIATLVTWTIIVVECRRLEKKQMIKERLEGTGEVAVTEEVLVNPSLPEPSDMTGVLRRIIEHALNVNPSLDHVCQKRRTFSNKKSRVVTNEVAEWVKAGIVHPVKYPTYISNPVVVKKGYGT